MVNREKKRDKIKNYKTINQKMIMVRDGITLTDQEKVQS